MYKYGHFLLSNFIIIIYVEEDAICSLKERKGCWNYTGKPVFSIFFLEKNQTKKHLV